MARTRPVEAPASSDVYFGMVLCSFFAILASVALLHWITTDLPAVEFRLRTYQITLGLGGLYLVAGALVWYGAPLGRVFSRVCSLLYLARPGFGLAAFSVVLNRGGDPVLELLGTLTPSGMHRRIDGQTGAKPRTKCVICHKYAPLLAAMHAAD